MTTVNAINERLSALRAKYQKQLSIIDENAAMGVDIRDDRIAALETETEINQVLAERNRLLKNQQRGYLDAIQQQAFGAGKFEKIIVSQDRNIGRAIGSGLVRRNRLLGATGLEALESGPSAPFRFGLNQDDNLSGAQDFARELASAFKDELQDGLRIPLVPLSPTLQNIYSDARGIAPSAQMPVTGAVPASNTAMGAVNEQVETRNENRRRSRSRNRKASSDSIASGADQIAQELSKWCHHVSDVVSGGDSHSSPHPKGGGNDL